MIETWKDIPGYKKLYQVSDRGRVKSMKRKGSHDELILKDALNNSGYLIVSIYNGKLKTYQIHQLVAMAFLNHIPCGHKRVVDHKDLNKMNNNLNNLRIVTHRENSNRKHLPSSSKYIGVCWDKRANKWRSSIQINGNHKHLGGFDDEKQASMTYQDALKALKL